MSLIIIGWLEILIGVVYIIYNLIYYYQTLGKYERCSEKVTGKCSKVMDITNSKTCRFPELNYYDLLISYNVDNTNYYIDDICYITTFSYDNHYEGLLDKEFVIIINPKDPAEYILSEYFDEKRFDEIFILKVILSLFIMIKGGLLLLIHHLMI
jgi:hypothetical protein